MGFVGAAGMVALAGRTVFGVDSRHAVVVADRNCCWWLEAEARSMRLGLPTVRCELIVAPRLEEWARTAADCRSRDGVSA